MLPPSYSLALWETCLQTGDFSSLLGTFVYNNICCRLAKLLSSDTVVAAGKLTTHIVDLNDCTQVCILVWERSNGILLEGQETHCQHQGHNHVTITLHPRNHLCCGGDCRCIAPVQHQDFRRFLSSSTWPQSVQRSKQLVALVFPQHQGWHHASVCLPHVLHAVPST